MKLIRLAFAFALLLVTVTVTAKDRDSYVLHFGGDRNTVPISGSIEDFNTIRGKLDGDYLWVRRGARAYAITDRASLAEVWDYFAPERALQPKQREIEVQTRKL